MLNKGNNIQNSTQQAKVHQGSNNEQPIILSSNGSVIVTC